MFDKTRKRITEPVVNTARIAVAAFLFAFTALFLVVFS